MMSSLLKVGPEGMIEHKIESKLHSATSLFCILKSTIRKLSKSTQADSSSPS